MTPKILIIDDDPNSLLLTSIMIKKAGYQALTARDARSALDILRKDNPELIIQDLSLPDLDGFHLVQCVRRIPKYKDIPVIVISGSTGRMENAKASSEHFVAFLKKPVNSDELLKIIKQYLPEEINSQNKMRS